MANATDIANHPNGLPRKMDEATLLQLVNELLDDGARLSFKTHALERMEERDITASQVRQVLRRGDLLEGPIWVPGYESWHFKMQADTGGETVQVAAAIEVEPLMGRVVCVISTF